MRGLYSMLRNTPATPNKAGVVKQSAKQAVAAGATPTKAEFDALIAKLVASGQMAAS